MSKIGLIANEQTATVAWRQATGYTHEQAPWLITSTDVTMHAPFSAVLCLGNWSDNVVNWDILALAMRHVVGRTTPLDTSTPVELASGLERALDQAGQSRPSARDAFPSAPTPSPQEQRLRDAGVNPALIGMLSDERRNTMCAFLDQAENSLTSETVELHMSGFRSLVELHALAHRIGGPWTTGLTAEDQAAGFIATTPYVDAAHVVSEPLSLPLSTDNIRMRVIERPHPPVPDPLQDHLARYMRAEREREEERREARREERRRAAGRDPSF